MDPSSAAEQPTRLPPSRSNGLGRPAPTKHRVDLGARLQLGPAGQRLYSVRCTCGWVSETCGTAVLAEADGEQHLTLAQTRRVMRRTAGA